MPEFGRCDDPSCTEKAVRLFDCAHHCMKMICLQHLIEHDCLVENNKRQLEIILPELNRLYSIYSSIIDEDKIRYEYEQKLDDYKKLVNEVNNLLENNSNDIEQFRLIIEKLKQTINEKQKQSGDHLTIVKVEPFEEISSSTTNLDTIENTNALNQSENKTIIATDDDDYSINTNIQIHRITGQCPLWINGSYGLNQEHHFHRLCRKKRFADLSNHIRQYHGFLAPIANIIARAVYSKIPVTKRLIPNNLQVADPRRSFFCPLRVDCQNHCWLSASSLRTHLIDVHDMNESMAEVKVKKIKILNKNKPMSKIKNKILQIIKKIESTSKGQKRTHSKSNLSFIIIISSNLVHIIVAHTTE
ncbi:unnamed protein product [Rotaria sp. Silwood2]|nr:unnamed protein product [Rotaria sp. Silwood2]CAF2535802.1 unnamed protein product [Rotaria sp. Silwood2]CAF4120562.1 unnamed protein product [Rotaria sp. Silwood2]CAF4193104.1 unnamed protein product [Rotaria sp. Silwood2]